MAAECAARGAPHLHGMLRPAATVQERFAAAVVTDRCIARPLRPIRRDEMLKKAGWVSAGLTLAALSTLASVSLGAGSAEAAVVYCKTVGVPKGCVVRPVVPVVPVAAVAATG